MVINDNNYLFSKMSELELYEYINNYPIVYQNRINNIENIMFGLEIEFDGMNYHQFKEIYKIPESFNWKLKVEGTIPSGAEITSPPLMNSESDWQELKKICEFIEKNGGCIDKLCSGHIHIAAQVLGNDLNHWLNFLKLWAIYEPLIYGFLLGDENYLRTGIWTNARPIRKDIYTLLSNQSFESATDLVNKIPFKGKLYGINFENIVSLEEQKVKNTIEIRCPNSSLNEIIWQNKVNMLVKMIKYSKSDYFNEDFINYKFSLLGQYTTMLKDYYEINLSEALEFVDLIFDNNLDKIYFLRQYINKSLDSKSKTI